MVHTQTLNRTSTTPRTHRGRNVVLWLVQIALAAMFLMAGASKLASQPQMIAVFEAVGIGQWFRYFTGGLEVLGALLLLIPALSGIGAALLAATMIGAILTHLFVIGGSALMPVVLLAAAALVAVGRWDRTHALLRP